MKILNSLSLIVTLLLLLRCNEDQQLPPTKPELETPTNSATGVGLDLTFKWKDVDDADNYNFQLSLQNDFATAEFYREDLTLSTLDIKSLKPGSMYYWRTNAENGAGVSPWSSTNSFTTKSLNTPSLLIPSDNSIVSVNNLKFEWNTTSDASGYNLQVSTSADFSSFVLNKVNLSLNSFSVSGLMYSTNYFWRVSSVKNNTNSSWSATRKFTTEPLGIPILIGPENNSKNLSRNIDFKWDSVNEATAYNIQVSTTDNFSSLLINKSNLANVTFSSRDFKWNTKYYWRVNAIFENCQSEWSEIRNFTTELPTEGLVAWYPFNGNANDESGNGNHGVVNGATLTLDRNGETNKAYSFDGVNDYINVTNPDILNFAEGINFTVSFFYNPESVVSNTTGFNGIVSRFHNNTGPRSGWQIGRDNVSLRFEATDPCGNNNLTTLTIKNWIHILQIYDRINGTIKTYINSTLVNSTNCSSISSSMINNYDLKIGVEREGYQFSSGKVDDLRIYNRALSEEEIKALYNE